MMSVRIISSCRRSKIIVGKIICIHSRGVFIHLREYNKNMAAKKKVAKKAAKKTAKKRV